MVEIAWAISESPTVPADQTEARSAGAERAAGMLEPANRAAPLASEVREAAAGAVAAVVAAGAAVVVVAVGDRHGKS